MSKQSLSFPTEVTIFIDAISREAANRLYRLPRKVHIFYKTKTLLKIREFLRPGCLPMRGQNRFMMTSIRRIYINTLNCAIALLYLSLICGTTALLFDHNYMLDNVLKKEWCQQNSFWKNRDNILHFKLQIQITVHKEAN